MKRILQVFSTLNKGGAESRVMDLYRALDKTQVQFDFAVTTAGEHFYMDEIRAMGGNIYYIKPRSETGFFGWFRQWKPIISAGGFYAVHSHTGFDSGLVVLAAWLCGVPKRISHARNMSSASYRFYQLSERILRMLIRLFSTDLIACSTEAGRFLFGKRTMGKRGIYLPNAINLDAYAQDMDFDSVVYRRELQIESFDRVLGTVGNLREVKNQSFMLDIMKEFLRKQPNSVLLIAGQGSLRQSLLDRARELGISEHIRLLGQRNDIPKLLRVFDIFLLTSFTEGLPGSVVEAQSANVPCILSDTITRDVDVGTGLVSYFSLSAPPDAWSRKIEAILAQSLPEKERTLHLLREYCFDVNDSLARLISIYFD
jgi:glycosyltransferase EpsF